MAWHTIDDNGEWAASYYLPTEPSEVYPGMSFSVTFSVTSKRNTMIAFIPVLYSDYASESYTIGTFTSINLAPGRTGTYTTTFAFPSDWIKEHIGSFHFGGNANFAGFGGSGGSKDSYVYVSYRLQPQIQEMDFERSDINGNWTNDGLYLRCRILKGAISAKGKAADVSKATIKVVGSDAGKIVPDTEKTITLSPAQISAVLSSNGYTEVKPILLSGLVTQAGLDYIATITFGDDFDQAVYSDGIMRSFARIHLSGAKKGGVAIGMFSNATDEEPKFEVAHDHESIFHGGIRGMTNLIDGEVPTGGHWIDGKPIYRYVYRGQVTFANNQLLQAELPISAETYTYTYAMVNDIYSARPLPFTYYGNAYWTMCYYIAGNQLYVSVGKSYTGVKTILLILEYTKPDNAADPVIPEGPEIFFDDAYPDEGVARADYIGMMAGIEIPETVDGGDGDMQSDSGGIELPGIDGDALHSTNYDKVKRYYKYDCWNEQMVKMAVGKWLTADEAESILNDDKGE